MGSQLTKNYDIEKEPHIMGGLHNFWKIYRGKKKDRGNMEVSIFVFDKKTINKKDSTTGQQQKEEVYNILKRDAANLAKYRHPSLLNLIEQPMEDQKMIVFVTEPVEYNLSALVFDASKKHLIPGDLEIKCIVLELMETLNFLHGTAKTIHSGLAPEHVYITKEGKLKLAGFNFPLSFSTNEPVGVSHRQDLRINQLALVPNFRFAAPEVSQT